MLKKSFSWILALITACLTSVSAFAVPITYLYEGFGTGTLGTTPFSTNFVITASADTANITPWPLASGGPQNTHINTTIQIDGLGLFTINTPSHTWLAQGCCGGLGQDLSLNWITLNEAAFVSVGYGLDTNFGPVTDISPDNVNQFAGVDTTGGSLTFASIRQVTFSATTAAVPEPASLALLALGLAGLGFSRRKRA